MSPTDPFSLVGGANASAVVFQNDMPSQYSPETSMPDKLQPVQWADAQREQAFAAWLQSVQARFGLQPESLRLASADASFRRYLRLNSTHST